MNRPIKLNDINHCVTLSMTRSINSETLHVLYCDIGEVSGVEPYFPSFVVENDRKQIQLLYQECCKIIFDILFA